MATDVQFSDFETLLERVTEEQQPIVILAGSGLTLPRHPRAKGVPGAREIVEFIRAEYASRPGQLERFEQAVKDSQNPYQDAFRHLIATRGQDVANRIIRRSVLRARKSGPADLPVDRAEAGDISACRKLEQDTGGWWLQPGTEALGHLLVKFANKFAPLVLTSNFDPLIELAIRRAGGTVSTTALHGDGGLDQTDVEGYRVVHIHGDWFRSDTLHTSTQLGQRRPHLSASLSRILGERTLLVLGYGGWDDVFMQSLIGVVQGGLAKFNVVWGFYEPDEAQIRGLHGQMMASLQAGIGRGRIVFYRGIDVHDLLPRTFDVLASRDPLPAALRKHHDKDLQHLLHLSGQPISLRGNTPGMKPIEATRRLHYASDAGTRFVSFYVPENPHMIDACEALLDTVTVFVQSADQQLHISFKHPGQDWHHSTGDPFSGLVYFYVETELTPEEVSRLGRRAGELSMKVAVRGPAYVVERRALRLFGEDEPPSVLPGVAAKEPQEMTAMAAASPQRNSTALQSAQEPPVGYSSMPVGYSHLSNSSVQPAYPQRQQPQRLPSSHSPTANENRPPKTLVASAHEGNVQVDPSNCLVRIGNYTFQLRSGTAPEPAGITFTAPQAGTVAASWDVYFNGTKVGWFGITMKGRDGRFRVAEARTYVSNLPADAHAEYIALAWASYVESVEVVKFQRLSGNVQMGDNHNDYLAFLADGTKVWVAMSGLLSHVQTGDHEAYYRKRMGDIPHAALRRLISENKEVRVESEYVFHPGAGSLEYHRLTFL
ncbi:SIR2 family protein [Sorangium sp. So ce362]|uniref:SIR2 family protein n=1 Tax=Sorangium sp. So ce362 TaxID=3133303 RepID=UPI003F627041